MGKRREWQSPHCCIYWLFPSLTKLAMGSLTAKLQTGSFASNNENPLLLSNLSLLACVWCNSAGPWQLSHPTVASANCVASYFYLIIFFITCGVTLRKTAIPVLKMALPKKWMITGNRLVGLQMKPTLSSIGFCSSILSYVKCLHMAITSVQNISLQRVKTKCVDNWEGLYLSLLIQCFNKVPIVFNKKRVVVLWNSTVFLAKSPKTVALLGNCIALWWSEVCHCWCSV